MTTTINFEINLADLPIPANFQSDLHPTYTWLAKLGCEDRTMEVPFFTHMREREPTIGDVLSCLVSDASCVLDGQTFEDFAADMGYDEDSRSAEATFRSCQTQTNELCHLITEEKLRELVYETDQESIEQPDTDDVFVF